MQAVPRFAGGDPGIIADAGMGIAAAGLTAVAAWGPPGLIGPAIAGPTWLRALLPLLMGASLVLRRRAPLLMWTAVWAGIALQIQRTDNPPHDQVIMVVLFAAGYSLGAYASLRRALAGLVIAAPVIVDISDKGGLLSLAPHTGQGAVASSFLQVLAFWLAGVLVRARRRAASLSARSAALQRQADRLRRPSGPGSPGNCTTSSPTTSA